MLELEDQKRALLSSGKNVDASRRFLPKAVSSRKRKAG